MYKYNVVFRNFSRNNTKLHKCSHFAQKKQENKVKISLKNNYYRIKARKRRVNVTDSPFLTNIHSEYYLYYSSLFTSSTMITLPMKSNIPVVFSLIANANGRLTFIVA